MADVFSAAQATRLFAFISAGGSIGAIIGSLITASLAEIAGTDGLLIIAIAGFLLVILLIHLIHLILLLFL